MFVSGRLMDEGPVNIVEDNFDGVIWLEFEGSLIGGEGKLISGSQGTSFLSEPELILPDRRG